MYSYIYGKKKNGRGEAREDAFKKDPEKNCTEGWSVGKKGLQTPQVDLFLDFDG